jgi:hypothetical protein
VIRPSDVSADHEMPPAPVAYAKQTLAGKLAMALKRYRRRPAVARAGRALRAAEGPPRPGDGERRDVILLLTGPGEWDGFVDTMDSIATYEPAAQVVVLADGALDLARARVEAAFPDAIFLRPPGATGGPPRNSPTLSWAFRWCLQHLSFDVLAKMDVDALLTGPGLLRRAADAFGADPALGLVGTPAMRRGGQTGDTTYSAWVLAHERRYSRAVRSALAAAQAHGWAGEECHGGTYVLSHAAIGALDGGGWLDRQPPWWGLVGEDLWFSLEVAAAGLRVGSLPGRPVISGQRFVPLPPQQVLDEGVLAIHSVKGGCDGETQAQLRAFFRAARHAPIPEETAGP